MRTSILVACILLATATRVMGAWRGVETLNQGLVEDCTEIERGSSAVQVRAGAQGLAVKVIPSDPMLVLLKDGESQATFDVENGYEGDPSLVGLLHDAAADLLGEGLGNSGASRLLGTAYLAIEPEDETFEASFLAGALDGPSAECYAYCNSLWLRCVQSAQQADPTHWGILGTACAHLYIGCIEGCQSVLDPPCGDDAIWE